MNTHSDKRAGLETSQAHLGQERPEGSVTPARADAGSLHGKVPVEITLPWPAKALSSNAKGKHWGAKHRATTAARTSAFIVAQSKGVGCWPDADILIEYWPATRRGDPQNVPASLKAYIDGIADAMGCDDRKFRVDYPRMFAGTKKGGEVVFRIYPGRSA